MECTIFLLRKTARPLGANEFRERDFKGKPNLDTLGFPLIAFFGYFLCRYKESIALRFLKSASRKFGGIAYPHKKTGEPAISGSPVFQFLLNGEGDIAHFYTQRQTDPVKGFQSWLSLSALNGT